MTSKGNPKQKLTSLVKPVHANCNAATAEDFFIAMAMRNIAAIDDDRSKYILLACRYTLITDLTTFNISSKITC